MICNILVSVIKFNLFARYSVGSGSIKPVADNRFPLDAFAIPAFHRLAIVFITPMQRADSILIPVNRDTLRECLSCAISDRHSIGSVINSGKMLRPGISLPGGYSALQCAFFLCTSKGAQDSTP